MKLNLRREWYEAEARKEEQLEVTAGFRDASAFRRTSTVQSDTVAMPPVEFVACIRKEAGDNLELRKIYAVLPLAPSEAGFLRVIDESGSDCLYPSVYFASVEVSRSAEEALLRAA